MKFGPFVLKILNGNEILAETNGHNSGTNVRKMMCNNPKIDLNLNLLFVILNEVSRIFI